MKNFVDSMLDTVLDEKMGLDIDHFPISGTCKPIDLKDYWKKRKNDRIYIMSILFSYLFCRKKYSVVDIGCHVSPLVLMLPEFKMRFAIDPSDAAEEAWKGVDGAIFVKKYLADINVPELIGNNEKFDLVMCNQVIEHLENPEEFAQSLLAFGKRVIISTTFETPEGLIPGHIQDPISLEKLESWFSRRMICSFVSRGPIGSKIVAVY